MSDNKGTEGPGTESLSSNDARSSLSSDSAEEQGKREAAQYSAAKTPYTSIPPVTNAYKTGASMRTFRICGETKSQPLFCASVHLGFSDRGPLGTRPGVYLHNGMSVEDPILAAAGDEDRLSQRAYAFNNSSVVLVPRFSGEDDDGPGGDWVTELMVASTTGEGEGVVFHFAISAGRDQECLRRERFEWRKFKKGIDAEYPGGGFKLFRLPRPTIRSDEDDTRHGDQRDQNDVTATDRGCVAVWESPTGFSKYWDHLYTLKFVGSDLSKDLGDRWQTVVVVTAARLWLIKVHGKTKKSTIRIGEKMKGKFGSTAQ